MTASASFDITRSGTLNLAGKVVHRLGFGTNRLADPMLWGPPADRDNSVRVVRRAVELGVDFIDTADSYSFGVIEEIIREALHPYPEHLLISTKAGYPHARPGEWVPLGRPEYLRQQCELSLRRLNVERIDLFHLHRVDPKVPFEDQVGELKALQDEGKIGSVGLSEVDVPQIEAARQIVDIASIENIYNLAVRTWDEVLDYCARERIAFLPWFPMMSGALAAPEAGLTEIAATIGTPVEQLAGLVATPNGAVTEVVAETGATPAQVALAWLLARADVILPIPGTSSATHLEENVAATGLELTAEQVARLSASAATQ